MDWGSCTLHFSFVVSVTLKCNLSLVQRLLFSCKILVNCLWTGFWVHLSVVQGIAGQKYIESPFLLHWHSSGYCNWDCPQLSLNSTRLFVRSQDISLDRATPSGTLIWTMRSIDSFRIFILPYSSLHRILIVWLVLLCWCLALLFPLRHSCNCFYYTVFSSGPKTPF